MRSKIPVFGATGNFQNEDNILLGQVKPKETYNTQQQTAVKSSLSNDDYPTDSYSRQKPPIDTISQCTSDNDLYEYHDKSSANRIDEWQAAYNVTNAIQVNMSFVN